MFFPSSSHLSHSLEEEEEEEEDIFFCSSSKTNFHVRKNKKWNISKKKNSSLVNPKDEDESAIFGSLRVAF